MKHLILILPCARHFSFGLKQAVVLASPPKEDIKSGCSIPSEQGAHKSRVKFLVHGCISFPVNEI